VLQRAGSGVQQGEWSDLPAGSNARAGQADRNGALPLFLRKGTSRWGRPARCTERLAVVSSATIGPSAARTHRLHATLDLLRRTPDLSAARPAARWQRLAALALVASVAAGGIVAPGVTCTAMLGVISIVLLCIVLLRGLGLVHLLSRPRRSAFPAAPAIDHELPLYSVLVPLYREAEIVPDLLKALAAIDYPADRLDVLLVAEEEDVATQAAIAAARLAPNTRMIVVPPGRPRTKPRALNFALEFARGAYVVVFDAEDVPEPGQLRRALGLLRSDPERLGCVQARLAIYNTGASWLSAQFALEYAALIDGLLPALERLGLPIPLGGTSNHFPREVLERLGRWDPFNVTEDADLGLRLARAGVEVRMLDCQTWEEAPTTFRVWRGQRTRWLKGWLQTYVVHMRRPWRLLRDLGPRRFLGFQLFMAGTMVSALVHPWFYVLMAIEFWQGPLLDVSALPGVNLLWWTSGFILLAGYALGVGLGAAAVLVRGRRLALLGHAAITPLYWLLISFAAYRALFQLVEAPHLWEKTRHSARTRVRTRRAGKAH
jgi:cellulose synthase/poly-beta-1,6-N-acetylglucosamine synthase-like glycosyltransferase